MGFFFADDTTPHPDIRWLNRDHLPAVVAIDRAGCPGEPPWTRTQYASVLAGNGAGMVALGGGIVDGVVVYEFYRHQIVILRLCVRPARRRHGVGRALLERVADKLAVGFHTRMVIHTHERNDGAHRFLARLGFRATLCPRHFPEAGGAADSYLFARAIGAGAAVGARKGAGR